MSQKSYLFISNFLHYLLVVWFIGGSFQTSFSQVINYDTKVIINDKGKKITERTVLVQVNNKQENWLSHIEMRHNPKQEFTFNYANIFNSNGDIVRKLKKKELITRNELSYKTYYQDDLVSEFDLYWNQYPYRIEYSYTIEEDEYLYIAWWTPLLYANATTIESSLEINLPADYVIYINSLENTFEEYKIEGRKILSWQSQIVKMPKHEIYAPPTEKLIPIVKIVPPDFKYGVSGVSKSWSSFGLWLDKLNKGTDQITLQEKQTIESLIDSIDNRNEIIKKIYHYLQDHTKYVNVTIDVGGLKSYPASYVCTNKYGDCKALTTYMKAMLKSVGIESFYTTIKAGENEAAIDLNLPCQQFNHVILMIPSINDTLWLENTSNALPFNYLGTSTQNRYALVVNGEESQLVKTPELLPAHVMLERDYNFQLSNNDEARIELNVTLRGNEFEDYRYLISEKDEKHQNEEILKHSGIGSFNVDEWSVSDFERDSSFVHLDVMGTSPSIVRKIGSLWAINPLRIDLPDFEQPNQRELAVIINYPISRSDKSVYELQIFENSDIQIPEGIRIESKYGRYYSSYKKESNKLIVDEIFVLFANEIPIDKYKDFYQFIESINTHKKKTVILIK